MTAYYNEFDPYAAQWLRNLIAAGLIAPGIVDERSIEDVTPSDLKGFTQCHFFAGIGVWSHALRRAGWPDDLQVWTGSCPCQPFSAAGKGDGFADQRHLWPHLHYLIQQRRPAVVLGEQVASKDGLQWFDLVHADLEGTGYSAGASDLCAAGVGAPHVRQRLFWLGYSNDQGLEKWWHRLDQLTGAQGREAAERLAGLSGVSGRLADPRSERVRDQGRGSHAGAPVGIESEGLQRQRVRHDAGDDNDGVSVQLGVAGPTNGFWRDADWLACRDGKWRPVEPGTFPLGDGASSRVGRLRAYGNAIVAEAAETFIRASVEAMVDSRRHLKRVSEIDALLENADL